MNKTLQLLGIVALTISFTTSCKEESNEAKLTTDDAADVVAASIGTGGYGQISILKDAVSRFGDSIDAPNLCDLDWDTAYTVTNVPGNYANYQYNLSYGYKMNCKGNILDYLAFTSSITGKFETSRFVMTSSETGTSTVTGLLRNSPNWIIAGNFKRTGTGTSHVRNENSFDYELTIVSSDVLISKADTSLVSGTSTVTIHATTTQGKEFDFSGTLTYPRPSEATLVVNNKSYTIDLKKSEVK